MRHTGVRIPLAVVVWAPTFALIVAMLALAGALGTHAIIFPEAAALAVGVWVLALPGWAASRWHVAVLPPACALLGVVLLRLGQPGAATAIAAATLALAILHVFDSRLLPALSAAVLPIVFDVRAWDYPLAVLAICVAIAGLMPWLARRRAAPLPAHDAPGRYPVAVVGAALGAITGWMLLGGELLALPVAALAPPLFVSALEWLGQGTCSPRAGLRRCTLLTGAALAGAVAAELVHVGWIAGALALAGTLGLMWLSSTLHPPAFAIALIPQILEDTAPVTYVLAIAAGAAGLYLAMLALDRAPFVAPVAARATGP